MRKGSVLLILFISSSLAGAAPVPQVITEVAKLSKLSDQLTYPARVESKVNSLIYAESDGVVTEILAPLGSHVHRGSKLAVIKHTDPVYQYAPMSLTSQVDGIVSQVAVTEGSTVNKGALIASVTDPNKLKIIIEIAASDLTSFKAGMVGHFEVSGASEKVPVTIKGYSPYIDPATGTAECDLTLDQKEASKIPPGSVGQVYFEINKREGFVFPESAIFYRGPDTFIRKVENGIAHKIPVTLGRRERGKVEIVKGVQSGDQVIERASQFIGDGDKVQIDSASSSGG